MWEVLVYESVYSCSWLKIWLDGDEDSHYIENLRLFG